MSETKRFRGSLLVVVGLALIGVTILVLVSLYDPLRGQREEEAGAGGTQGAAGSSTPAPAPLPGGTPAPAPGQAAASVATPPVPTAGAAPAPPPGLVRAQPEPAVPAEVENERDPMRKSELMKMHRLTTARVRVSMLRRRQELLRRSLTDARKHGGWSVNKIQDAERQLEEIGSATVKATERLEQVRQEVGGDIDKGAR